MSGCKCAVIAWKKQVFKSPLVRVLRFFYAATMSIEPVDIGWKSERIYFLKKLIKKRLPRRIVPFKIWIFAVEEHGMLNPFSFTDDEEYIETLIRWTKNDMKDFILENPRCKNQKRHKKIYKYKLLR